SLGGCVALLAYDDTIDCLGLWYPAVFPRETETFKQMEERTHELDAHGRMLIRERDDTKFFIGKEFYHERATVAPFARVKDIVCPLLIVVGDHDTGVPSEQSYRVFDAAREPKKLVTIEGADHCFWLPGTHDVNPAWQREAIDATSEWFVRWLCA
ncbi:prolyl oligopeptidase family serine peptidase, partial [Candidatus Uhrbacteria bacterium]|nr:prolyl oligopeptidase family serine peptidase [Candidatus Uhrbacteria bacterium]